MGYALGYANVPALNRRDRDRVVQQNKFSSAHRGSKLLRRFLSCFLLGLLAGVSSANAQVSWSSCESDLDGIARLSRDAGDASESLQSIASELEDLQETLEDCRSGGRDQSECRDARYDYSREKSDFQREFATLASTIDNARSRVQRISRDCVGYTQEKFTCDDIRNLRARHSLAGVLEACGILGTIPVCVKCLGLE